MKNLDFTRSAYQRSLTQIFSFLFVFSLFLLSGCQDDVLTEIVPDGTVEVRHDDNLTSPPTSCNCSYFITSFDGPAEGVAYAINELSNFCPGGCPAMDATYVFDDCFPLPGCTVNNDPDPTGIQYPFNCSVPNGASFDVRYIPVQMLAPDCRAGSLLNDVTIEFFVSCDGIETTSGCPGVSSVSNTFSMTGPTNFKVLISNLECGCIPSITL